MLQGAASPAAGTTMTGGGPAPISAFIVCKNEKAVIGPCIESLDFCQEIVIVDSGSTDGTLELIESYRRQGYPIRLIERDWPGFARQKQFALEQCAGPWCLMLDADERLDPVLKARIAALPAKVEGVSAFSMQERDYLVGYGYVPWYVHARYNIRLVQKGEAFFNLQAMVHESFEVKGPVRKIRGGTILHFRALSISEDAARSSSYAALKARQRFESGRRTSLARLALAPAARFLKSYVAQRYFLCGKAGFIYSTMLAQYVFLTEARLYRLSLGKDAPDEIQPGQSPGEVIDTKE
jgi:glycosyltransferase involved in cell wall biosynthesis